MDVRQKFGVIRYDKCTKRSCKKNLPMNMKLTSLLSYVLNSKKKFKRRKFANDLKKLNENIKIASTYENKIVDVRWGRSKKKNFVQKFTASVTTFLASDSTVLFTRRRRLIVGSCTFQRNMSVVGGWGRGCIGWCWILNASGQYV